MIDSYLWMGLGASAKNCLYWFCIVSEAQREVRKGEGLPKYLGGGCIQIGPSEVRATSGANLGRPLFLVLIHLLFLPPLLKSQKGLS